LTVGLGIAPNLLTLLSRTVREGRRSRAWASLLQDAKPLPPVGNFTPPWEHLDLRAVWFARPIPALADSALLPTMSSR